MSKISINIMPPHVKMSIKQLDGFFQEMDKAIPYSFTWNKSWMKISYFDIKYK
jgi:hypothetical protein